MMSAWEKFLVMLITVNLATGTWAQLTGIRYFMATCGKQNCDTVCSTFGLQCASTGQSFSNASALPIFESLGITCKTNYSTDVYSYKDQPNYITDWPADGNTEWVGRCTGFKAIPSTIDCQTANNTKVRRLCPCFHPSVTQPPRSSTATLTSAVTTPEITPTENVATSAETRVTQERKPELEMTTGNGVAQPQEQIEGRNDGERTALIVVAILAAGLVLCLVGLVFLFLSNRRQLREKEDEEPHSEKFDLEYRKSNSEADVPDIMDGLTVEINTEEDNSYCDMRAADLSLHSVNEMDVKNLAMEGPSSYEDMTGKSSDNVLYAITSVPGETRGESNAAFSAEQTVPVYDRLV